MKQTIVYGSVLVLSLGMSGCGTTSEPESTTHSGSSAGANGDGEQADHAHDDGDMTAMEKMGSELAKLSPEDAAAAEKQHVCPVSGEMLGTMGPPIKVDANGQQVWICCAGCRDALLENPDEYLAKLETK